MGLVMHAIDCLNDSPSGPSPVITLPPHLDARRPSMRESIMVRGPMATVSTTPSKAQSTIEIALKVDGGVRSLSLIKVSASHHPSCREEGSLGA